MAASVQHLVLNSRMKIEASQPVNPLTSSLTNANQVEQCQQPIKVDKVDKVDGGCSLSDGHPLLRCLTE